MNSSLGIPKTVSLAVGEQYHLKRGKDRIVYAGMPSEDVYSIVQMKAMGYQGYSWNLYFSKSRQDITIDGVSIYVEKATPDGMTLRVA
jgi:hypothetical protein